MNTQTKRDSFDLTKDSNLGLLNKINSLPRISSFYPPVLSVNSKSRRKLISVFSYFMLKPSSSHMSMILTILSMALLSFNVSAALKTTTALSIMGTAPYLTFDGGETKATDTATLLSLKLSDGRTYNQADAASTELNPIELPVDGQSMNDVTLFIPRGLNAISLNTLIGEPYNYWGQDDGDGSYGVQASGNLSVVITNSNNQSVSRNDELSPCDAPYKLTLNSTMGILSTEYGYPSETEFNTGSASFYIKPKERDAYVCYAKPNPEYNYGTQPEWNADKGYKLKSLGETTKNFPRTGINNVFFDITIFNATAQSVIDTMTDTVLPESGSGVTLSLAAISTNVLRVTLKGLSNSTNGGAFTASTFRLKTGTTEIYNFQISKWFVPRPGYLGNYANAQTYCNNLTGGYRVPSVSEYTDANGSNWTGGLAGWNSNTYARAIGNGKQMTLSSGDDGRGGLFSEWGNMADGFYPDIGIGANSRNNYWAVEESSATNQFNVYSGWGDVAENAKTNTNYRTACVTP